MVLKVVVKGLRCLFLSSLIILPACYRHPDLNGQTIGSLSGAIGGGLFAASQVGDNLIFIGAGTIIGSILGGVVGTAFDDMNRNHIDDPALWPIVIDCYQTRRPTYRATFCPGIVVPPDSPYLYASIPWANYPLNY